MNTRNKGNRNELKCQQELEAQGYFIQRAGYRRFAQNDFWGVGDMLAIKPNEILLVQVKSNAKPSKAVFQNIADFATKYPQFKCEIWVHIDRKGWRKWFFTTGTWVES